MLSLSYMSTVTSILIKRRSYERKSSICTFTIYFLALGSVNEGDRIWWVWKETDVEEDFTLTRVRSSYQLGFS